MYIKRTQICWVAGTFHKNAREYVNNHSHPPASPRSSHTTHNQPTASQAARQPAASSQQPVLFFTIPPAGFLEMTFMQDSNESENKSGR